MGSSLKFGQVVAQLLKVFLPPIKCYIFLDFA